MGFIQQLFYKIRHKSIIGLFRYALMKVGINVYLFYLVEEALRNDNPEFELDKFPGFNIEYLEEKDMTIVSSFKERPWPKEELLQRLKEGCKNVCVLKKMTN